MSRRWKTKKIASVGSAATVAAIMIEFYGPAYRVRITADSCQAEVPRDAMVGWALGPRRLDRGRFARQHWPVEDEIWRIP